MPKLPKPVNKKSSKKDLWEELQAARQEIEHQQERLNELSIECSRRRTEREDLKLAVDVMTTQLKTIRAAASLEINLKESSGS